MAKGDLLNSRDIVVVDEAADMTAWHNTDEAARYQDCRLTLISVGKAGELKLTFDREGKTMSVRLAPTGSVELATHIMSFLPEQLHRKVCRQMTQSWPEED